MKQAYSYIRFSTPDQIKGDSLRRQTEATERFCQRHKLKLDQSLNIQDLGTSAYKGDNASTGNLGKFLELIEARQVKKGSVLVVEKLDRLSRQEVLTALHLFEKIIRAGVDIGVVDNDKIYGVKDLAETTTIMMLVLQFATANEESKKKSERISAAWVGKRKKIGERKITGRCPAWLKLAPCKTKFDVIEDRARIVQDIYKWTIEGYGLNAITRRLMQEGIKPFEAEIWHRSYVMKILSTRAVIGEFQPRTANPNWKPGQQLTKHVPVGEPITDYFPVIISETVFYKARKAMADRKTVVGKPGTGVPNLFTGFIFNLADKSSMTIVDKGSGKSLVASSAKIGLSEYISFPYNAFESAFLRSFKELKPKDVMPVQMANEVDESEKFSAELVKVEIQIAKMKKRLVDDLDFDSGLDVLKQLEAKKKSITVSLEDAKSKETTNESMTLKETQSIIDMLQDASDSVDLRTRIKAKIRSLVEGIYMKVRGSKTKSVERTALVNMKLKNGVIKQLVVNGDGSYTSFNYGVSPVGNFKRGDVESWVA